MIGSVRLVFVLDCKNPLELADFWSEAIGYRIADAGADPYVVLAPDAGQGPTLLLQRVPEPKTTKNRMHLDIRVEDLDATVDRLERLGAARLHDEVIEEEGFRWFVMADPEGNEFCVVVEPQDV